MLKEFYKETRALGLNFHHRNITSLPLISLNMSEFTTQCVTLTKIYNYDQITAISQKVINFQLSKMYIVNKSLKTVNITTPKDDWVLLKCDLNVPVIKL